MCLIALSIKKELDWKGKEGYFFTIVANRDEYHDRPTKHLHWWEGDNILAVQDELAGRLYGEANAEGGGTGPKQTAS